MRESALAQRSLLCAFAVLVTCTCCTPSLPHADWPPFVHSRAEGVHSREAIDMVKEHVLAVLGPASMAFSNTMIKMSKLQAAQVRVECGRASVTDRTTGVVISRHVSAHAVSATAACFSCDAEQLPSAALPCCAAGLRRVHHVWLLPAPRGQALPAGQAGGQGRTVAYGSLVHTLGSYASRHHRHSTGAALPRLPQAALAWTLQSAALGLTVLACAPAARLLQLGVLPESKEDAVERLERLFHMVWSCWDLMAG